LWTNKGKNAHKTEILTNKTSGRIFTTVRDTKGEEQLVQLNGRKLTEDEAWATFKVIHNITSGASFHDKIKVQGFSGMTNGQFLSMVYSSYIICLINLFRNKIMKFLINHLSDPTSFNTSFL